MVVVGVLVDVVGDVTGVVVIRVVVCKVAGVVKQLHFLPLEIAPGAGRNSSMVDFNQHCLS